MSERLMILKMLDEGKITLEEADALLEALNENGVDLKELGVEDEFIKSPKAPDAPEVSPTPSAPSTPRSETAAMSDEELEDYLEEQWDEIEDSFDEMEDEIENLIDDVLGEIDDIENEIDELYHEEDLAEEKREELIAQLNKKKAKLEDKEKELAGRKQKFDDQRRDFNSTYKKGKSFSFDFHEGVDEFKRAFEEIKHSFQGEGMEDFKAGMKDFSEQFSEGMNQLKEGLEEGTKEVRKALEGKDFKQVLGSLFKNFGINFGNGMTLEEEVTGSFDPEQGPVQIDLSSSNGRIEVIGTEEADYRLCLKYTIHASSEEEAHQYKEELTNLTQSPTLLQFETRGGRIGGVGLRLYLPKRLEAEMKLKTSNGRITLEGLQNNSSIYMKSSNGRLVVTDLRAKNIEAKTSNGRIEFRDFATDEVDLHTSNGSIFIEGLCNNIVSRTSNGSVTVYPFVSGKGNLDVHTSHGKIKVILGKELAADLDATTSMGSINFNVPDLTYQKQVDKHGRKDYQAQTNNYIASEKRIQIQARTSMGSIYIGQEE